MKNALILIFTFFLNFHSAMAADDEVLTSDEAAAFLKISPEMIKALFIKKEIPGREIDGELRFSKKSFLLWLENTSGQELTKDETSASKQNKKEKIGITAEEETDIEAIAFRDRAALNKSGKLSAELGLIYTKQQNSTLTPTKEEIASLEQRDMISTLSLRYGFWDGYQLRLSAPYQYSSLEILYNGYQIHNDSSSHYGPTNIDIQKILLKEGLGYPGIICGLGSGIGNKAEVTANCTLSKTYDPAILYASTQYSNPLDNDLSWNLNGKLGVGLKINEMLMLDGALLGRYVGDQKTVYGIVSGREDFGLSFGLNWRIHKDIYLAPSIETILTADGNEFTFSLSLIYEP